MAGLTTALLLSKSPRYSITVVAKHMPGDYDIEYASPWAGANYLPYVVVISKCLYGSSNHKSIGYHAKARLLRNMTGTHGLSWKSSLCTIPKLACIFKVSATVKSVLIDPLPVTLDTAVYNRQKDLDSVTGDWFAELLSHDPWFKDTLPNVSPYLLHIYRSLY